MEEPESEQVKVEKVKHEAIIAFVEVLLANTDPENKARVIEWAANNANESKRLFPTPLVLDYEALASYEPPQPAQEPGEPRAHDI